MNRKSDLIEKLESISAYCIIAAEFLKHSGSLKIKCLDEVDLLNKMINHIVFKEIL